MHCSDLTFIYVINWHHDESSNHLDSTTTQSFYNIIDCIPCAIYYIQRLIYFMTKFVLLDFSHLFQYKFPSSNYLNIHWKYWCWSWNSNTLATWCQELTHWKRPWCWETLKAGGEGDDRGWDGWMASPTQWAWVWVNSGSWWWTERPGVLQSMGSQRLRHDWATELNWTSNYQFLCIYEFVSILLCLSCLFFFF